MKKLLYAFVVVLLIVISSVGCGKQKATQVQESVASLGNEKNMVGTTDEAITGNENSVSSENTKKKDKISTMEHLDTDAQFRSRQRVAILYINEVNTKMSRADTYKETIVESESEFYIDNKNRTVYQVFQGTDIQKINMDDDYGAISYSGGTIDFVIKDGIATIKIEISDEQLVSGTIEFKVNDSTKEIIGATYKVKESNGETVNYTKTYEYDVDIPQEIIDNTK